VKWVKNSFFKARVFRDRADLEEQLATWLVETNTERPNRATNVIPEARRREELARLRALGVLSGKSGHACAGDGLSFRTRHVRGRALHGGARGDQLSGDALRLRGSHSHRSGPPRQRAATPQQERAIEAAPEHLAARVAAVFGKRGKLYEQHQQLLELGPVALEFFTELVHRRRKDWPVVVESNQMLLDHGEDAMRSVSRPRSRASPRRGRATSRRIAARTAASATAGRGSRSTRTRPTRDVSARCCPIAELVGLPRKIGHILCATLLGSRTRNTMKVNRRPAERIPSTLSIIT
jgi:hypothetical protein